MRRPRINGKSKGRISEENEKKENSWKLKKF